MGADHEADLSALGRKLPFFSFGERDPEIAAAAVPVFWWKNGAVDLLGALGVSGPLGRFDAKVTAGISACLLAEGRELSSQLGGPYDLLGIK